MQFQAHGEMQDCWNRLLLESMRRHNLGALLCMSSLISLQSSVNATRDEHVGTAIELHRLVPRQLGFSPLQHCLTSAVSENKLGCRL